MKYVALNVSGRVSCVFVCQVGSMFVGEEAKVEAVKLVTLL